MYNFIWGLQAVLREAKDTLMHVTDYPLFWGFAMGFLVSTIVHAFLMTDSPRQVPAVLFRDKSASFEKLYPPRDDGSYARSYASFSRMVDKTKLVSLLAVLLVTILILIAVITK